MRRIHIILLAIFMTGVLLGGIGTGIAFGEYSTMEYGETVMLGEDDLVTGELIYEFEPVPGEKIAINPNYLGNVYGKSILEMDESLPMGTICYDVTYNSKLTAPHLSYWEAEKEEAADGDSAEIAVEEGSGYMDGNGEADGNETSGKIEINEESGMNDADEATEEKEKSVVVGYLELRTNYIGNEFELVMKNKDNILADFKKKKINSYETAYITDVKIRVNPDMMDYIEDRTMN